MSQMKIIEHQGKRVLTTNQIAEAFGTETKIVSKNFERNEHRYIPSKHFYVVQGEELKALKASRQIDDNLRFAPVLYLWTEKGAWMHAKSIATDRAWDAYEMLVDEYYERKDNQVAISQQHLLAATRNLLDSQELIVERMDEFEQRLDNEITLNSGQQRTLQLAVNKRVCKVESDKEARRPLFQQLHREIKDRWQVASYKDVRKIDLGDALAYVAAWVPIRREGA